MGSKPQCAQQQNDNKISQPQRRIRLFAEKADQKFKLTDCQKLRDGFLDFRIGELCGDIFRHMLVKR